MRMTDEVPVSISIIIPTYNRPKLLEHAVQSAIAALPDHGEIIVADDTSDPPARKVLEGYNHPGLRIVVNTGQRGAAANRNNAVRHARSDLLLFLDDDDLLLPSYPARVLEFTARVPEAVWGFSSTLEHDTKTTSAPILTADSPSFLSLENTRMRRQISGLGWGLWVRRSQYLEAGGIDEDLSVNEDTDFCLRLLSRNHIPYRSPEPGVSLLRQTGLTVSTPPTERMRSFERILQRHGEFLTGRPKGHRFVTRRFLKFAAKSGQLRSGMTVALTQGPRRYRLGNFIYLHLNFAMYRLSGRRP